MRLWSCFAVFVAALGSVEPAGAQEILIPGNEWAAYYRLLEIAGNAEGTPFVYHSASSNTGIRATTDSAPWSSPAAADQGLLPVAARLVFNSRYPSGINDQALWAGRGFSGVVSGGARVRAGPLTASLYPTLWLSQNRGFDVVSVTSPGRSPLVNPWHPRRIDWPQRFGTKGIVALDPGQSDVRITASGLTAGVSTESMVWGPAFINPILMSATAPGFPHVDLGTARALRTPIGPLETRLVWGRLAESEYFDTLSFNDARLFTGLTIALRPRWLPGLTLGLTRVLYTTWDSTTKAVDFVDVFQPFFKDQIATSMDPEGNDDRDQLLSLIARWVLPESGFEAYVEWARNDHNRNLRDLLGEPDHSQAYTLGFAKSLGRGVGRSRLRGEWTHLGRSETFQTRATPTYYTHHIVTQGYTHRGQLLGAGIGPGSNSQHIGFDRYSPSGRWGGFVQRVGYDDDAYYQQFAATRKYEGHDVEVTLGLSFYRQLGMLGIGGSLALSQELNRHYVVKNDATNLNLQLQASWQP